MSSLLVVLTPLPHEVTGTGAAGGWLTAGMGVGMLTAVGVGLEPHRPHACIHTGVCMKESAHLPQDACC